MVSNPSPKPDAPKRKPKRQSVRGAAGAASSSAHNAANSNPESDGAAYIPKDVADMIDRMVKIAADGVPKEAIVSLGIHDAYNSFMEDVRPILKALPGIAEAAGEDASQLVEAFLNLIVKVQAQPKVREALDIISKNRATLAIHQFRDLTFAGFSDEQAMQLLLAYVAKGNDLNIGRLIADVGTKAVSKI